MKHFYSVLIYTTKLLLGFLALFNNKIRLGVEGRKNTFRLIEEKIPQSDNVLWFHCASLGEYEQGFPVFEALKKQYSDYKIVLSFFSPSGYENKKNSPLADVVVYLPLDTAQNAAKFLNLINPKLVVFVKYDIWPNYLLEVKKHNIEAVLISAVFRKQQIYFKWFGSFFKKALFAFKHIFTQDELSKNLLEDIGYKKVSVSGDTRFDRVHQQLNANNYIDFIDVFKGASKCIVFGSTWPADNALFVDFINNNTNKDLKFIIAPHEMSSNYIKNLKDQLNKNVICFSELPAENLTLKEVFILDTIGYLSRVYSYADIAYVGGAVGNTGLHNILEPAVFGVPILIGNNFKNFPEARALVAKKGVITVKTKNEFEVEVRKLLDSKALLDTTGKINSDFVEENKGALSIVMGYLHKIF